jgi:DNA polymerase-3 subunit gamma/tau
VDAGREPAAFIRDLEMHSRELLVVGTLDGAVPAELAVTPERDARLGEQAARVPRARLVRLLDLLAAALEALKAGADGRTQLELALVKAASPAVDSSPQGLMARIEQLESALAGGARPAAAAAPAAPPPQAARTAAAGPEAVAAPATGAAAAVALAPRPEPEAEPEPEPELQPVAAAAPRGDIALELETLISQWPAVLDTIRTRNALLAAVVEDARPVALADGRLTLAFPGDASFLRKKAEEAANREAVAAALRTATGHALALSYELRDADPEHAAPSSEQEWIARLVAEFGAEELDSESPT